LTPRAQDRRRVDRADTLLHRGTILISLVSVAATAPRPAALRAGPYQLREDCRSLV